LINFNIYNTLFFTIYNTLILQYGN